jgi:uncharacterized protein (DUF39 family)
MSYKVIKSFEEINKRIKEGKAVVVNAEEMIDIVSEKGEIEAAKQVDVVTTGTFAPMCSSGAIINFGHTVPGIRASKVWLNDVSAYGGLAAVDCYIGATEPKDDDPLNKVYPGEFLYGGGHVIHDLVDGKSISLVAEAYGTHCYPKKNLEKRVTLKDLPYARLLNPRNAYQNYNCAVNVINKTIYTYMGVLKGNLGNANFSTSGQLSPLFNDPYFLTIGMGTRIFLGGGIGYVIAEGTQHKFEVTRTKRGIPITPSGTLMLTGDMKQMSPDWLVGVSLLGYGCSLSVGVGIPIPVLNEEIAYYTGVSDGDISTKVIDYGDDYPAGKNNPLCEVTYKQLKSGFININNRKVPTASMSSYKKAKEISEILKKWIVSGQFLLGVPQENLPSSQIRAYIEPEG